MQKAITIIQLIYVQHQNTSKFSGKKYEIHIFANLLAQLRDKKSFFSVKIRDSVSVF